MKRKVTCFILRGNPESSGNAYVFRKTDILHLVRKLFETDVVHPINLRMNIMDGP